MLNGLTLVHVVLELHNAKYLAAAKLGHLPTVVLKDAEKAVKSALEIVVPDSGLQFVGQERGHPQGLQICLLEGGDCFKHDVVQVLASDRGLVKVDLGWLALVVALKVTKQQVTCSFAERFLVEPFLPHGSICGMPSGDAMTGQRL